MIPNARTGRVLAIVLILLALCLPGCGTKMTIEPNRAGAESGCADHSGNLSQYNDCMEQVDSFYREYEEHRKLSDQDKDR